VLRSHAFLPTSDGALGEGGGTGEVGGAAVYGLETGEGVGITSAMAGQKKKRPLPLGRWKKKES